MVVRFEGEGGEVMTSPLVPGREERLVVLIGGSNPIWTRVLLELTTAGVTLFSTGVGVFPSTEACLPTEVTCFGTGGLLCPLILSVMLGGRSRGCGPVCHSHNRSVFFCAWS